MGGVSLAFAAAGYAIMAHLWLATHAVPFIVAVSFSRRLVRTNRRNNKQIISWKRKSLHKTFRSRHLLLHYIQTKSMNSDKVSLITISTEVSASDKTQGATLKAVKKESTSTIKTVKTSDSRQDAKSGKVTAEVAVKIDEAAKHRQKNGKYLAVGVTLVFLFIAFYHTVLRHATILAGLLAPAIIMLLYIIWLLYFAKKKKMEVSSV